jgi:YD repeat-containing protein
VVSSTQINLGWTASTDNVGVTAYRIERCSGASCTTFAQIASIAPGTNYSDTTVAPQTSYSYRVRATDAAGNLGAYSNTASATTGADVTPPSAPAGLTATATSITQITVSWTAATDNVAVTGYRIERCQGAGCSNFVQIASVGTVTSYSDTSLSVATAYSYRVRASDAAANLGAYSSIAAATTLSDTTAPTAPGGLIAAAVSNTQVNLTWTASTDNVAVTSYFVERCSGAGCATFAQIGTLATTTYSDSGLAASTSYNYRVRATDAAGNLGAYSSTATVITASGASNSTYIYDATGHLKTVTTTSGSTTQYTYDAAGNLTGVQQTP